MSGPDHEVVVGFRVVVLPWRLFDIEPPCWPFLGDEKSTIDTLCALGQMRDDVGAGFAFEVCTRARVARYVVAQLPNKLGVAVTAGRSRRGDLSIGSIGEAEALARVLSLIAAARERGEL